MTSTKKSGRPTLDPSGIVCDRPMPQARVSVLTVEAWKQLAADSGVTVSQLYRDLPEEVKRLRAQNEIMRAALERIGSDSLVMLEGFQAYELAGKVLDEVGK